MLLLDSSFMYAVQDQSDKYHDAAMEFLKSEKHKLGIPDVALTEVTQVLNARLGKRAVRVFIETVLNPASELLHVESSDLVRVNELLTIYADTRADFVDLCIVAIAERLNITDICTFDRRDFMIVRPRHAETLTLLP